MPTDYTLAELSKLADVTPRTIRYYIGQGLLPSPTGAGPAARYTEDHLERLRVIKRMQAAHLPLGEIRSLLRTGEATAVYASEPAAIPTQGSATDYIRDLLARRSPNPPGPTPMPNLPSPPAADPGPPPTSTQPTSPEPRGNEPDRGTWERISLHPDIELHVRRPLSRLQNKRVERLVSIARQLLEEE